MCVCIYMYICMYVYTYICAYICAHAYVRMHTHWNDCEMKRNIPAELSKIVIGSCTGSSPGLTSLL